MKCADEGNEQGTAKQVLLVRQIHVFSTMARGQGG